MKNDKKLGSLIPFQNLPCFPMQGDSLNGLLLPNAPMLCPSFGIPMYAPGTYFPTIFTCFTFYLSDPNFYYKAAII